MHGRQALYQQVAAEARTRVDALVRQAQLEGTKNKQVAERQLAEAKQLAISFGHDVRVIDDRIRELSSMPAIGVAVAQPPAPVQPKVAVNQGQLLLENARLELRKGETKMARRMCEETLNGKFGLENEAVALLRSMQKRSFCNADGVIFLTRFAERTVLTATGPLPGETTIIPHGVAESFFKPPRPQQPLSAYSHERPFRLLYTSIVDVYKHQWHIAEAVAHPQVAARGALVEQAALAFEIWTGRRPPRDVMFAAAP